MHSSRAAFMTGCYPQRVSMELSGTRRVVLQPVARKASTLERSPLPNCCANRTTPPTASANGTSAINRIPANAQGFGQLARRSPTARTWSQPLRHGSAKCGHHFPSSKTTRSSMLPSIPTPLRNCTRGMPSRSSRKTRLPNTRFFSTCLTPFPGARRQPLPGKSFEASRATASGETA